MQDLKTFNLKIKYSNDLELVQKVLTIYLTMLSVQNNVSYRNKLVTVLSFYVLQGYTKETKNLILKTLKMNSRNLTQVTYELTKLGLLVRPDLSKGNWAYNHRELSPSLQSLRDYVLKKDYSHPPILLAAFDRE